jgi:N-acetylglutamate synthase-like GNAT family acetyltransferase
MNNSPRPVMESAATNQFPLRVAGPSDAGEITRLINSAFRLAEGFFVEGDRIELDEVVNSLATGKFLLAEDGGKLVGCVYVEPRGERAYLGLLSVDPSRQKSGLGSRLMTGAEDYCSALACRFMDIKIVNLRKDLPDFYRSRGYVETGISDFPPDIETLEPCYFIDMTKSLERTGFNESTLKNA